MSDLNLPQLSWSATLDGRRKLAIIAENTGTRRVDALRSSRRGRGGRSHRGDRGGRHSSPRSRGGGREGTHAIGINSSPTTEADTVEQPAIHGLTTEQVQRLMCLLEPSKGGNKKLIEHPVHHTANCGSQVWGSNPVQQFPAQTDDNSSFSPGPTPTPSPTPCSIPRIEVLAQRISDDGSAARGSDLQDTVIAPELGPESSFLSSPQPNNGTSEPRRSNEACDVQICKFGSVWCARVFVSNTVLIESIPSEHQKVMLQSTADNNAIRHHGTQISLLLFSSSIHHPLFYPSLAKFILAYLSDDDTKVYIMELGPRVKKESVYCVDNSDFLVYDVWAMLNIKSDYYNFCDAKGIYYVICQSWLRIKRLNLATFKVSRHGSKTPALQIEWQKGFKFGFKELNIKIDLQFGYLFFETLFELIMARDEQVERNPPCSSKGRFQTAFGPRQNSLFKCISISFAYLSGSPKHHSHPLYLCIWSNEMSFSFCMLREIETDISISIAASLTTKWKVQLFKANSSIMALLFDVETAMAREVHDESSLSCTSKALFQTAFGGRQICMVIWLYMKVIVKWHIFLAYVLSGLFC
ncbi:hypothetical protein Cgig2_019646 [Carnegiea gigantea]|uniref:Uncharacterized protein n=1 Tax=Carnegiea gigantea TaxID=171969 RepID=A0A9Q1KIW3_9CARY|nr:hypothetical protein Cgig2_019646 [Carnegiea gigantea]